MELFETKAPWIMNLLSRDFDLTIEEAAAILGNIGHESGGFKYFQEIKPVVPGSRGGFGWCQWTGPRRVAFEAYCKRNNLSPFSDRANYGFLFTELKGSERAAIPALQASDDLEEGVRAFESKFERAGVKHYPSRYQWARRALAAWQKNQRATAPWAAVEPVTPPDYEPPMPVVEGPPRHTFEIVTFFVAVVLIVGGFVAYKILT